MNKHRYILETYKGMSSRYRCPECNREKTFTRYIDAETGAYIADHVGRCNREDKCGYHYTPKQYFQDSHTLFDNINRSYTNGESSSAQKPTDRSISFIEMAKFKASLRVYQKNNLVKYLISLFGEDVTVRLIRKYFIGTSGHWDGATIFWQLDTKGKVRTGKIMLYSHVTGKRIKEPYNHIGWTHNTLKLPKFELKQCLFGEHLLIDKSKPVAIVESEKTAIIASVYLPELIWLAAGSLQNLNAEKCNVLNGRRVILFPDLNGYDKWSKKAKAIPAIGGFHISDLLERKGSETERKQGLDLADYLTRFNPKDFSSDTNQVLRERSTHSLLHVDDVHKYNQQFKKDKLPDIPSWIDNLLSLHNQFEGGTLSKRNYLSTVASIPKPDSVLWDEYVGTVNDIETGRFKIIVNNN